MQVTSRFDPGLVRAVLEVRDHHEWNRTTLENLTTRLMCVSAELREFTDAPTRAERAEELADVAMYLLVMIHDLTDLLDRIPAWRTIRRIEWRRTDQEHANAVLGYLILAFESWRRLQRPTREADICVALELALLEAVRAAAALDVDLHREIERKVAILYDRPPRHGGKHPDT